MRKSNNNERAKIVEDIMILSWDSLSSHIRYAYIKTSEGQKFHRQAIRDYLKIMQDAYELY